MLKMSSPAKVHDPLYNFETHFPERLSRLHLNQELSHSVRRQKRAKRSGARYKTQPVTFDEIQEVDEEPTEEKKEEGLKAKFHAFSRSMDGLLPKIPSGSPKQMLRRSSGHPPVIQERDPEVEVRLQDSAGATGAEQAEARLPKAAGSEQVPQKDQAEARLKEDTGPLVGKPQATISPPESPSSPDEGGPNVKLPSPTPPHRRQKITAKAKKRQKAVEESGGSKET